MWKYGRQFYTTALFGGSKKVNSAIFRDLNSKKRKVKKKFKFRIERFLKKISTKSELIKFLRDKSNIVVDNKTNYKWRRMQFDRMKWQFYKVWKMCRACRVSPTQHIHHVVLLKNGGGNDRGNLIGLCEECHCLIHDWMMPVKTNSVLDQEFQKEAIHRV